MTIYGLERIERQESYGKEEEEEEEEEEEDGLLFLLFFLLLLLLLLLLLVLVLMLANPIFTSPGLLFPHGLSFLDLCQQLLGCGDFLPGPRSPIHVPKQLDTNSWLIYCMLIYVDLHQNGSVFLRVTWRPKLSWPGALQAVDRLLHLPT